MAKSKKSKPVKTTQAANGKKDTISPRAREILKRTRASQHEIDRRIASIPPDPEFDSLPVMILVEKTKT